jgi:hypothetical protein
MHGARHNEEVARLVGAMQSGEVSTHQVIAARRTALDDVVYAKSVDGQVWIDELDNALGQIIKS